MPRRAVNTPGQKRRAEPRASKSNWRFGALIGGVIALGLITAWLISRPSPRQRAIELEAEARKGGNQAQEKWKEAGEAWKRINGTKDADLRSFLGEARADLALNLAAKAEESLKKASEAEPRDPEAYLRLLDLYRLEDRPLEAKKIGEKALETVRETSKREVLKALTLALLADAPDQVARATLKRFADADENDLDARLALLRRVETAGARPGNQGGRERLEKLEDLFARNPQHIGVREALALARLDEGQGDQVKKLLEDWPKEGRDARYLRLDGRFELDHEQRPDRAVDDFEKALTELPHDPRTRANLARALHATGRVDEARSQADLAVRIREILDPSRLGSRLDTDLAHLNDQSARFDLAELCQAIGLDRLAKAWLAIDRTDDFGANPVK